MKQQQTGPAAGSATRTSHHLPPVPVTGHAEKLERALEAAREGVENGSNLAYVALTPVRQATAALVKLGKVGADSPDGLQLDGGLCDVLAHAVPDALAQAQEDIGALIEASRLRTASAAAAAGSAAPRADGLQGLSTRLKVARATANDAAVRLAPLAALHGADRTGEGALLDTNALNALADAYGEALDTLEEIDLAVASIGRLADAGGGTPKAAANPVPDPTAAEAGELVHALRTMYAPIRAIAYNGLPDAGPELVNDLLSYLVEFGHLLERADQQVGSDTGPEVHADLFAQVTK